MKIKNLFIAAILLQLFAVSYFAQDVCPEVTMIEPSSVVFSGEPMKFTAVVKGLRSNENNSYNWTIDKGTIVEGQGTSMIIVDTAGIEDEVIKTTVSVSGNFLESCDHTAEGVGIVASPPKSVLITTLRHENCEILWLEIDNYTIRLQNDPSATGYIILYGNSRARPAAERAIKNYIRLRRFDASRFVFLNGDGSSPAEIEFWIVPQGTEPPVPNDSKRQTATTEKFKMPNKPVIFDEEFTGEIDGCYVPLDVEGYAAALKVNPKSRGNIVIYETSQKLFRQKEKEILDELTNAGIARNRLRTFYKKIGAMNLQEGTKLWLLP